MAQLPVYGRWYIAGWGCRVFFAWESGYSCGGGGVRGCKQSKVMLVLQQYTDGIQVQVGVMSSVVCCPDGGARPTVERLDATYQVFANGRSLCPSMTQFQGSNAIEYCGVLPVYYMYSLIDLASVAHSYSAFGF